LQTDFLAMLGESLAPSPAKKTIPKLVWPARTVRDNFEALELLRQSPRPPIIICTGDEGLASRVLARKFGAFATFAAVAAGREAAAGQPSIADMKNLYRWDTIDAQTRVYGVLGDPVQHSLSPRLHNAAFAATGENAVYLPMRILGSYESFKAFMVEVAARPWLDFRGFSVTIPHKQNALRYLRETGGTIDPLAQRIGALNTLTLAPDGHLTGHNTDCPAALEAITTGLTCQDTDLAGLPVAVLGAGGVARGVVAGLADAGADITIFNRTEARAEALSHTFACRHRPWKDRLQTDATLLVNCTSVGLWPDVGASPMPADALVPGMTVFDTIYTPRQTRLLREAAQRGCPTIDGLSMFILQARSQLQLWTGQPPAPEFLRLTAEGSSRIGDD
jgi:3-dehydroquinate dehydratase/shikimate dehydrogenase